jgi:hypothetical protein
MKKLTLLCEMCKIRHFDTAVGKFNPEDLQWPMDLSIFKSPNPQLLPDPFPVDLLWHEARCRQCGGRPFLNTIPQAGDMVMLVDGTRVKQGSEGRVLTLERGYIPIPGYPGAAPSPPPVIKDKDGHFGTVVEKMEKYPGAPPSENDNGPFQCLVCGKCYKKPKGLAAHKCKGA